VASIAVVARDARASITSPVLTDAKADAGDEDGHRGGSPVEI
jgi:hypothetical protein